MVKSDWNIRECFSVLRGDKKRIKNFHDGDIILTAYEQDKISNLVEYWYPQKNLNPINNDMCLWFIKLGSLKEEYFFSDDEIFGNIEYFFDCFNRGMSPYKALEFFYYHLNPNER